MGYLASTEMAQFPHQQRKTHKRSNSSITDFASLLLMVTPGDQKVHRMQTLIPERLTPELFAHTISLLHGGQLRRTDIQKVFS